MNGIVHESRMNYQGYEPARLELQESSKSSKLPWRVIMCDGFSYFAPIIFHFAGKIDLRVHVVGNT